MRDEDFEGFIEDFGEATEQAPVSDADVATWSGILPNQLLHYWKDEGWCGYANGLVWTVNPSEFEEIKDEWLRDTFLPQVDNFHVIARTAFGKMFLWGEKTGNSVVISPCTNMISGLEKNLKRTIDDPDFYVRTFFGFLTKNRCDVKDEDGRRLFDRAVKKLGPLRSDEVFGFEPALVLGGRMDLNNIRKLNMDVHLTILRQFGSPDLSFSSVDVGL